MPALRKQVMRHRIHVGVWFWLITLTAALTCTLPAATVGATPSLRVRAKAHLELRATQRADRIHLQGVLEDDLGVGLGKREVELRLDPTAGSGRSVARIVHSDTAGGFTATFAGNAEHYRARADFGGDAYYERSEATAEVESQRSEVQLEFAVPSDWLIHLDDVTTQLVIKASSPAGAHGLTVDLQDELGRELASAVIADDDSAHFEISAERLGEPGLGELVVRSAGDDKRAPAFARKAVLRTRRTALALDARLDEERHALHVAAALKTASGPLPQRAVGFFLDGEHLGTLLTDRDGKLARAFELRTDLATGVHRVEAHFESDAPGLLASHAPAVELILRPLERTSVVWLIAAALLSVAFAVWSMRRKQQLESPEIVATDSVPPVRLGAPVRGRPALLAIDGRVRAADTGQPLAATILLETSGGTTHTLRADASGQFASRPLPAGRYRVTALADGYARAQFELDIPHAGTGTAVQITLASLRVLALEVHALLGQRVLAAEGAAAIAVATAREVLRRAAGSGSKNEPELARLTDLVELVAYARAAPTEHDLVELRDLVIQQLARFEGSTTATRDPGWEQ